MYLKRLELVGFKSFANKTVLDFALAKEGGTEAARRGITAIVGPNGSGKSNIADAIRFCIGEQSSKNLRGKKSEDVIFAGTETKARLGSASVTLHFDNSDKRIPIEYGEVSIMRKVHRTGESEYSINGNRVRLLDVVDMLAKAGIGKESYCVITQGMSDAMLLASPLDRRAIFEDAAGVKPYQLEKERAIRKLESTRENLARADSLILEIGPHLKNLKRQAERASQGKILAETLREKQVHLYGFLWHTFQAERGTLLGERDRLEAIVSERERDLHALRVSVNTSGASLRNTEAEDGLEAMLTERREELNTLLREGSVVAGKLEIEAEKRVEREEVRVIPVDLPYVTSSLERIGASQEKLIERIKFVEKLEDLQDIREFATAIKQDLADLTRRANEGSVRETVRIGLLGDAKKESDERLKALTKESERIQSETERLGSDIALLNEKLQALRASYRVERESLFEREKKLREGEGELQTLKDEVNELRIRLARVEVREEDLIGTVKEELSLRPEELLFEGEAPDREKLEREIARLKVECEHAGSIDPLIVEEYEETAKRYEFLTRESDDLKKAIESLKTVMKEMDEKIDEAFERTFEEIRTRFMHYFKVIFGGGKAEVEKIRVPLRRRGGEEGEEPTGEESEGEGEGKEVMGVGIEIKACPPGKRIANLSMLSGGERSLTSLALLFAIISHNPPPFAMLDEVEAALDEANSRRFGELLAELSGETQFIAITHNRETMRQASMLYGVTMGEQGVSQLLAVHLDQIGEKGNIKKA